MKTNINPEYKLTLVSVIYIKKLQNYKNAKI